MPRATSRTNKGVKVAISLPIELFYKLHRYSIESDLTMSWILFKALTRLLDPKQEKELRDKENGGRRRKSLITKSVATKLVATKLKREKKLLKEIRKADAIFKEIKDLRAQRTKEKKRLQNLLKKYRNGQK